MPWRSTGDLWWRLDHESLHDEKDDEDGDRCPFDKERHKAIVSGMRLGTELGQIFDLILGRKIRGVLTESGVPDQARSSRSSNVDGLGGDPSLTRLMGFERGDGVDGLARLERSGPRRAPVPNSGSPLVNPTGITCPVAPLNPQGLPGPRSTSQSPHPRYPTRA